MGHTYTEKKNYFLFIQNSNLTGSPVFHLATVLEKMSSAFCELQFPHSENEGAWRDDFYGSLRLGCFSSQF